MLVSELIDEPSKLCKYTTAVDISGTMVGPNHESAVAWCVIGGIMKCYKGKEITWAHERFRGAIGQDVISDWSDTHEFEEVHKALLLAGI